MDKMIHLQKSNFKGLNDFMDKSNELQRIALLLFHVSNYEHKAISKRICLDFNI